MRAWATLLSAVALSACGGRGGDRPVASAEASGAPSAERPPAAPFPGKRTADLVGRAEVAALVDALAAEKRVESSHVGAGGTPSGVYARYAALAKAATDAELVALLEHESAVVRAYVARHVAAHLPAGFQPLVALAKDETLVDDLSGCSGGQAAVGALVREALCESPLPEAGAALVAVHDAGGPQAASALACAAPLAPDVAGPAAVRALRRGPKPAARADYLAVLAVAPAPEACELARAGADTGDASVQIGAAKALWRCDDDASRRVLAVLAGGKNVVVARHARASQFLLSPADRPALAADRDGVWEVQARLGALLRSAPGTKAHLPLVEALVGAFPGSFGGALHGAAVTPETTAFALRVAGVLPPQRNGDKRPDRTSALRYLARAKDRAALPELRRSLDADDAAEVRAALDGLVALGDAASKPAVEKLAKHPLIDVARAARDALPKL